MLQSKADRERQKLIADKCQSLIEVLLKDDDNKYCVDCDAKGPRWASWNLGIFLCIRCAGIHRNLGVHISRVKSVNLDAWTPEHVAYVQRMGNSRARAIYEANLPDDFRRPQTDAALESFIRAKYEHKKYIAQDYVDPGPPEPAFNVDEELKRIKEQKRSKITGIGTANKPMISVPELLVTQKPRQQTIQQQEKLQQQQLQKSALIDDLFAADDILGTQKAIPQPNQLQQPQQQQPALLDNFFASDDILGVSKATPQPTLQQQQPAPLDNFFVFDDMMGTSKTTPPSQPKATSTIAAPPQATMVAPKVSGNKSALDDLIDLNW